MSEWRIRRLPKGTTVHLVGPEGRARCGRYSPEWVRPRRWWLTQQCQQCRERIPRPETVKGSEK